MEEIRREKKVSLRYRMRTRLPDGALQECKEERVTFVYGVETQVSSLEKAIEGRRVGDVVSLTVPPCEIYGEHDPGLVVEIPKKGLIRQRLKEGQFYRQMKMGSLVSFKVLEVRPDTVLADFNGPLTGIHVDMEVEVLDVRDASRDEIGAAAEAQVKRTIGCG